MIKFGEEINSSYKQPERQRHIFVGVEVQLEEKFNQIFWRRQYFLFDFFFKFS
jgi:hypothetical protein